jgi:hypothetical protein
MYLLITNTPKTKTNWVSPKITVYKRGTTPFEAWWYASPSLHKLKRIREELRRLNKHASPPIRTRIRSVNAIPRTYS